MKIGIDIDGCLIDFYTFTYVAGERFCQEHGCGQLTDPAGHTPEEIWGLTEEEVDQFWEEYQHEYINDMPARSESANVIDALIEQGHEIYIITARRNYGYWFIPSMEADGEILTEQWLARNGINYDYIVFGEDDKGARCRELGIDIFVDDSPRNLRTLQGNTNTVVFWAPCNDTAEFEHLPHINNWWEFYDIVQELDQQNQNSDSYDDIYDEVRYY